MNNAIPIATGNVTRAGLIEAIRGLYQRVPTIICGLNIRQFHAAERMYKVRDGERPHTFIFSPANGLGKTQFLVQDMIGWCKGREFLKSQNTFKLLEGLKIEGIPNGLWWPEDALAFYDALKPLRDAGKLSCRIVCDADDMKEGGSIFEALKQWCPDAQVAAVDSARCFRQIVFHHPEKKGVKNTVAVKTFDQEVRKHSGSNCHRVFINEPMPQELWGETAARTRSKKGEVQGSIIMAATVLNRAPYVSEIIQNEKCLHMGGVCWENCAPEEVTDQDADDIEKYTGDRPEKRTGGGYLTYGVLSRESILKMIDGWRQGSPHEVDARKFGTFMHLSGRVFTTFDRDVHIIPRAMYAAGEIPEHYPVIMAVDPHPRKPDMAAWFLLTPAHKLVTIAEWPAEPLLYENLKSREHNIEQTCEIWRKIEAEMGIGGNICARIGDPNMLMEKDARDNRTLQYLYSINGFHFKTNINDSIELGYREIQRYMFFDKARWKNDKHDPIGTPMLLFSERCPNIWRAIMYHQFKEKRDPNASPSESLDPKFKHGVDLVRYVIMWLGNKTFDQIKLDFSGGTDYDLVRQGRIPGHLCTDSPSIRDTYTNLKGRRLVGSHR